MKRGRISSLIVVVTVALVATCLALIASEAVGPSAGAQTPPANVVTAAPDKVAPKLCSTGGAVGIKGHYDQGQLVYDKWSGLYETQRIFTAYTFLPQMDGTIAHPYLHVDQSFTNSILAFPDATISGVMVDIQDGTPAQNPTVPNPSDPNGLPILGAISYRLGGGNTVQVSPDRTSFTSSFDWGVPVNTAGWYRLRIELVGYVQTANQGGGDFSFTMGLSDPVSHAPVLSPTCAKDPLELACPCNPASGIVNSGTATKGDPVTTGFGNFVETDTDLDVPTRGGGLSIGRSYNSRLGTQTIAGTALGYGWTSSFGTRLEVPSANGDVTLRQASGAPAVFSPIVNSSPATYTSAPWVTASLQQLSGGGFKVIYKDGHTDSFNAPVSGVATLDTSTNRNGYGTKYDYTSGKLSKITDLDSGRHIDLSWVAATMTAADPAGRSVTWTFTNGELTDVMDVEGHHHKYSYATAANGAHLLTHITAPKQVEASDGTRDIVNHYDSANRVDTQSDNRFTAGTTADTTGTKRARVTVFGYTGGDINTSSTSTTITVHAESATGAVLSQRIDTYTAGQRTQSVDGTGTDAVTRRYSYDPQTGGVSKVEVKHDATTWKTESETAYDYLGNTLKTTRWLHAPADPQNPALGDYQTVTYTYGTPGTSTYAKFGEPLTVTDTAGVVTTNTYDTTGNLTSTCTPLRPELPNAGTTVACAGDSNDQKVSYVYSATKAGDVTWVEDPLHQVACTDATCTSANASHFVYDANGYVQEQDSVTVPQPSGPDAVNKTTFAYDNVGRLMSVTSPAGYAPNAVAANFTTTVTSDKFGSATRTSVPNPAGGAPIVTARHFDSNHNLDWSQPADGNCDSASGPVVKCTTYSYNERDELTLTHRPEAGTDQASDYTPDGHLKTQTDATGAVTAYTWDSAGRAKSVADASSPPRVTTYGYDTHGRLATRTDPASTCGTNACVTTYSYDDLDRLSGVTNSDGTTPNLTNFQYDGGNRRTSVTAGSVITAFAWDTLGRMRSSSDAGGEGLTYGYDMANNLKTIQYPGGNCGANPTVNCVTRGYDPANRLTSIKDPTNATTTLKPDQDGNYVTYTFPGTGDIDTYAYDSLDRMMSATVKANNVNVASMVYERSTTGLVTHVTETGLPTPSADNGSHDVRYGYDNNNRLCWRWANAAAVPNGTTCGAPPSGAARWTYDGADNITHSGDGTNIKNDPTGQVCYSTSGATTNACTTPPTGATTYTADNNANRSAKTPPVTSSEPSNFKFDQQHRLTQAKVPAQWGNAGEYTPISPWRALDSRDPGNCTSAQTCGQIPANSSFAVQVTGANGVPAAGQVAAVMFNLTVVAATPAPPNPGNGYVTSLSAAPTGSPATSNVNYSAGQTLSNGVVTKTDANGKIYLYNSGPGTVDVIVDVNGWYASIFGSAGGTFTPVNPARLYDSRSAFSNCSGTAGNLCSTIAGGATRVIPVGGTPFAVNAGVPTTNVASVTVNLTATGATQSGTLTAYAGGTTPPTTSVWFAAGQTVGELNVVKVAADGTITIKNNSTGPVDIIIDVFGWSSSDPAALGSDYVTLNTPVRADDSTCPGTACGTVATGSPRTIAIANTNGIPIGATAVTANITAKDATANGFLTVYPADQSTPNTSNVNYAAGAPQANGVTVKLSVAVGNDGKLSIAASGGNPNVIVDITGYYKSSQSTFDYTYNADGNRVTTSNVAVGATTFIWNYAQGMPMLAATKYLGQYTYYSYGPGELPLAQTRNGATSYLHHDQIGSTRLATSNTGAVTAGWTYDPYGTTSAATGATSLTPLLYTGQFRDGETGFYNLRARFYDPATSQFISRDPLAWKTRHSFVYVADNPIALVDPMGLCVLGYFGTDCGRTVVDLLIHTAVDAATITATLAVCFGTAAPTLGVSCIIGYVGIAAAAADAYNTVHTYHEANTPQAIKDAEAEAKRRRDAEDRKLAGCNEGENEPGTPQPQPVVSA